MINHDIMRLNISVHYTHTVTVVKSLTTQNKNKQVNNYLNRIQITNNSTYNIHVKVQSQIYFNKATWKTGKYTQNK